MIGLKENVIIGKLIPAGTGMKRYRTVKLDTDDKIIEDDSIISFEEDVDADAEADVNVNKDADTDAEAEVNENLESEMNFEEETPVSEEVTE